MNVTPTLVVVGSKGVLESVGGRTVWHTEDRPEEVFASDAGAKVLFQSQLAFAGMIRDALLDGAAPPGTPTFADGLAWNQVLERLRA